MTDNTAEKLEDELEEVSAETEEQEENPIDSLDEVARAALVEALIFAHGEPIGVTRLSEVTTLPEKELLEILQSIEMKFELDENGFQLVNVAGKYQFRTKGVFSDYLQKLKKSKPRRLSPAALETLAVVAYRQPIVKADIEGIRGVDCTPTIKTLLERGVIRIVGHKATVGQPALYGTTDKFLSIFGLRSLSELPTLRDLQELEQDPGEELDGEEVSQEVDEEQMQEEQIQVEEERLDGDTSTEISV